MLAFVPCERQEQRVLGAEKKLQKCLFIHLLKI